MLLFLIEGDVCMGKKKLKKYASAKEQSNIIQPEVLDFEAGKLKEHWDPDFFGNDNSVRVELGCGKGEYTLALAKKFPDRNFIGVDIKSDRMLHGAEKAEAENLKNICFVRLRIEFLATYFPKHYFSEGWITFPDPYESTTNGRRRLTSERFLNIYRSVFKPGSRICLKTDSRILYEFSLESLHENGADIVGYSDDLYTTEPEESLLRTIQTTYEKRYLQRAVKIKYVRFAF